MKAFAPKRIAAAACIAAAGLALYSFSTDDRLFRASKNLEVFNAVFKELDMFYVDTIKPEEMIQNGVEGMLALTDPYTEYYPEEENDTAKNDTYGAENTLKTIAGIILGLGIIAIFISIISVFATGMPFITVLGIIILFLIILGSWALLRCFANISITLKEIKARIK